MIIKKTYLLLISCLIVCHAGAQVYKNPKADINERVEDLLRRMTLEEKIAQMNMNGMGEYAKLPYGAGVMESPFISV